MQKFIYLVFLLFIFSNSIFAQDHTVTLAGTSFNPPDITIQAGETVLWDNIEGLHNVNGSLAAYPNNPEGFSSGTEAVAPWTFTYTFTIPGFYDYHCDPHLSVGMTGTVTVLPSAAESLVLTGIVDGPLSGGTPKAIEIYALENIPDLSRYSVGSANNGDGSDGPEFTFPSVTVNAGTCIYVATDSANFNEFFDFFPDYVDGAAAINGDDAIELFLDSTMVIDVFGYIDQSGEGSFWNYQDGWVYRIDGTGPNGNTFEPSHWIYGGVEALDGETTNGSAQKPFPVCSYSTDPFTGVLANDDAASLAVNTSADIDVLINDYVPNSVTSLTLISLPASGNAAVNGLVDITYQPGQDFCGPDMFMYEVCDGGQCDTATVFIEVICLTNYPKYDIAKVTTIDANGNPDSLGVSCELEGIVLGVDLQGGNSIQFSFVDATGGISLFSGDDFGYTVQEGDRVIVRGEIDEFNCLTQIAPDTLWKVDEDNDLPDPIVLTGPMTESHEGELIRINNLEIVNPGNWSLIESFNVDATDMVDTFSIRIDSDVDIFGTAAPAGKFDLLGIGAQFDDSGPCDEGYQILPRYLQDIMLITSTKESRFAGKVDVFPNPATGFLVVNAEISPDVLRIYNILGKQVLEILNPEPNTEINLSDFERGAYVITLWRNGEKWSRLVVKQ